MADLSATFTGNEQWLNQTVDTPFYATTVLFTLFSGSEQWLNQTVLEPFYALTPMLCSAEQFATVTEGWIVIG